MASLPGAPGTDWGGPAASQPVVTAETAGRAKAMRRDRPAAAGWWRQEEAVLLVVVGVWEAVMTTTPPQNEATHRSRSWAAVLGEGERERERVPAVPGGGVRAGTVSMLQLAAAPRLRSHSLTHVHHLARIISSVLLCHRYVQSFVSPPHCTYSEPIIYKLSLPARESYLKMVRSLFLWHIYWISFYKLNLHWISSGRSL